VFRLGERPVSTGWFFVARPPRIVGIERESPADEEPAG